MEIIIWIIVAIIYAIAEGNNRTGRMFSSRRRYGYGLLGMQDDFSLDYDPLSDIRQVYNDRLQLYYAHNKPKTYLVNKNCEARLIKETDGQIWFYVKSRCLGKLPGAYFEIKGNNTHASTMWAILDMEFNSKTRFADMKDVYYKLNQGFETRGGLKYFYQPIIGGLPKPITNQYAQNEFCKIEIQTSSNDEKILVCSEIWGTPQWDKQKKFIIKADKLVLYGILADFSKNKNKMINYLDLLYHYLQRTDCTVQEINDINETIDNTNSSESTDNKKDIEPIKYIHVDFDEKKDEVEKNDKKIKESDINKNNERNLDL